MASWPCACALPLSARKDFRKGSKKETTISFEKNSSRPVLTKSGRIPGGIVARKQILGRLSGNKVTLPLPQSRP